jgi:hypothetical protein
MTQKSMDGPAPQVEINGRQRIRPTESLAQAAYRQGQVCGLA